MADYVTLDEEDIEEELRKLPLWVRKENEIIREFVGANFAVAVGIVNAIAILAEKDGHHPDILLYGWNKVRITLTTHFKGCLTDKDFLLAKKIDGLSY